MNSTTDHTCPTCGYNVTSDDPNEHGIGFNCSIAPTERDIDEILDKHAEVYATATAKFITNMITEEERDKEYHHSDLTTKHAIQKHYRQKFERLIGEDEILFGADVRDPRNMKKIARNGLRANLRDKLK